MLTPRDDDARNLAELFVFETLDDPDRADVAARLVAPASDADHALVREVALARERFMVLDDTAAPLPLPANGWDRLARALDQETEDRGLRPAAHVIPLRPVPSRAAGWRVAAWTGMAASVVLAAALGWQVMAPPAPAVIAILLNDQGQSVAVIEAFADDRVQITPLAPLTPGAAEVLQVWTKPDPAGPPVSLGLLDRATRVVLAGPELPVPVTDQLYEITLEPAGGSPTGLPTGPILGKGLAQPAY